MKVCQLHSKLTKGLIAEYEVDLCQLPVNLGDLSSIFVNFPCRQEIFHRIPSTFCTAWRPSVNFRQLPVPPGYLPLTSMNFPCRWYPSINFRQFSIQPGGLTTNILNFCVDGRPSVKLSRLFLQPGTCQIP